MTTMYTQEKTCAVCARPAEVIVVGSSNEFGSKDLDLRPAEMLRSTYAHWTEHCSNCGYCASDISEPDEYAATVVQSDEYQAQLTDKNFPHLANIFLCEAMILKAGGHHVATGFAYLHAAWACDDDGNAPEARNCRLHSLAEFESVRASGESILGEPIADYILLADLQRRAGEFDFAAATCVEGISKSTDAKLNNIIRFQQYLSAIQDSKVHKVEEAFKWAEEQSQRVVE